jgi:phage N-6-adenine-methyltransferase
MTELITARRVPVQKPGRSKQDYATPRELIDAVEARFRRLDWDLAASAENRKAAQFYSIADDSLRQDWTKLTGNLWLNPPFADIEPWAAKCAASTGPGRRIFLLTPASVGSNWFAEHVFDKACVIALRPRMTFVGATDPYPKDLILSVFGRPAGFELWRWK